MPLLLPALVSLLFFFSLPISLLFLLHHQIKSKSKLNTPPGPTSLPIIGNLHQLGPIAHRSLHNLSKRYGPIFRLKLGRVPALVVSSHSLAEQVLKTQDLAFCSRPPLVCFQEYSFNGCDVATAPYGDHWRNLRKIFILELLSSKKLPAFTCVREEENMKMIEFIQRRVNDKKPVVNISELTIHMTNSVINRVAFGYKNKGEYGERSRFQGILLEAHALMASFFAADYFPGFGWIDVLTGKMRKLKRNSKKLDDFYQEVIDQHLIKKKGKEGCEREEDIVDVMLKLLKEGEQISLDHIKGSVMNILIAGTDTSATTVVWAMTELIRNPNVMEKVQGEVREMIGNKGKVEESDLHQLQYLKFVVNETLRLHPPLPLLVPRETTAQCTVNGYDIPKKTRVLVNVWAIGRDENVWEKASEFNPDRFIRSSVEYRGHNFELLPFGAGRRICPGIHFGIANVELALANLLYAFNWTLPEGMKTGDIDMYEAPGVVTQKKTAQGLYSVNSGCENGLYYQDHVHVR